MYTLVVRRPSGFLEADGAKESEFVVVLCLHGEANGRLLVVQML